MKREIPEIVVTEVNKPNISLVAKGILIATENIKKEH